MEIFRATRVGAALIESLNQLIDSGDITSDVANEVLQNYEQIFLKNYEDEISKKLLPVITIQGEIVNYNNFYNVWRFDVTNAEMKTIGKTERILNCRIIVDKKNAKKKE